MLQGIGTTVVPPVVGLARESFHGVGVGKRGGHNWLGVARQVWIYAIQSLTVKPILSDSARLAHGLQTSFKGPERPVDAPVLMPSMTANSLNHCPLLGFDPGRDKCGVAVMGDGGEVLEAQVVPSDRALDTLKDWANRFQITTLIIGDRTTSREWQTQIRQQLPQLTIITVNEQNSTLEARDRYWRLHPPRGFSRLIPQGLRLPPRPIDDIVAILLIERYLSLP